MQEIVSQEEIEWYARLREKEQRILDDQINIADNLDDQLVTIYEVVSEGLYKPYRDRDNKYSLDGDPYLKEWLEGIKADGASVIAYSTWRNKHKSMAARLNSGVSLKDAAHFANIASRAVDKLEANDVLKITASDGSRTLKTGEPVVVTPGENYHLLGKPHDEYFDELASMPTSEQATATVNHDMGTQRVWVSALWEKPVVDTGIKWRDFWGEVTVEDSQGDTPYQIAFHADSAMPPRALRMLLSKLSQKFAYLAMEAPSHNTEMSSQDDD